MSDKDDYKFCLFDIKADGWRVIWEITNTCNYSCVYCIFSAKHWKVKGELDTNQAFELIQQLKDYGIKYLKITWWEPFVRQDMIQILKYASDLDFRIDISTNASLLTTSITDDLAKIKLDYVHVSLDGHNKKIHETVRGEDTFERTIDGIKNLRKSGIYTRVWTVIFQWNEKHIEDMIHQCIALDVNQVIFSLMEPVGRMKGKTKLLATKNIEQLIKELSFLKDKYKSEIEVNYSFTEKAEIQACNLCPGWKKFLYINNLGQVSPCTWISEYLPAFISKKTLHNNSFSDIINSEDFQTYFGFLETLKNYNIVGCPKMYIKEIKLIQSINKLFTWDFEENIIANGKFSKWASIYSFTTENIKEYYAQFDFESKDLLVVTASGDHIINAYAMWANHVDCFDINQISQFYVKLKIQALKQLDFTEYKSFLLRWETEVLSYSIYMKVRENLDSVTKYFFDKLYSYFGNDGYAIRESRLFNNAYDDADTKIKNNYYLQNEKNYINAQKNIRNKSINFLLSSAENICIQWLLEWKKYDYIFLSNISDYAHKMFMGADYLKQFKWHIVDNFFVYLKLWWKLFWGYIYGGDDGVDVKYRTDIDNPVVREEVFGVWKYKELSVESIISTEKKDLIFYSEKN